MSERRDTETVMSSAKADTFDLRRLAPGIPCRPGLAPSSLSLRSWGSRAKTESGDRGYLCLTNRSIAKYHERFPFTCTTAVVLSYKMLTHLQNSGSNPAVSRTVARNLWSTLSNVLNWSELISATLVSFSTASKISCTKSRLFWIDLPFTA